jgi:PAS domain S-box-containing protein
MAFRIALITSLTSVAVIAILAAISVSKTRSELIGTIINVAQDRTRLVAKITENDLISQDSHFLKNLPHIISAGNKFYVMTECSIITADGIYFVHSNPKLKNTRIKDRVAIDLIKNIGKGSRYLIRRRPGGGRELLVAAPIESGGANWGVVLIGYSLSEVDVLTRHLIMRWAAIVAFLVFFFVANVFVTTGQATRPLYSLIEMLNSLTRQEKTTRIPLRATSNEVEQLSRAVNAMMDNWEKITNELRARQADAESQRGITEAIVDNIANGIIAIDRTGTVTHANRAAATHLGIAADDMIGKQFSEILPGWEGENTKDIVALALESGETYNNERVHYRAPMMEREAVFTITIQPMAEKTGGIAGAVALIEFLTDKVLLEEHLLRANEELRRANIVKSEFLSTVSHELRTPLTLIKMYSSMFAEGKLGELNPKQEKAIEVMSRRCKNLNDLINDLLDLSKIESGRMEFHLEEVPLDELIGEVAAAYGPRAAENRLTIKTEVESGLGFALADRDKLTRALNNLVENSVKFTERGGLTIRAAADPSDPGAARVCVSDTGAGVPEECRERIFEKFYQADGTDTRRHGGAGLGLSIAREIINLHGGRLWLEHSVVDEGSVFCFTIPFYDAEKADYLRTKQIFTGEGGVRRPDAEEPDSAAMPVAARVHGLHGVLIVDDDRDFLDMMREILTDDGFNVHAATDGLSALNELFSGNNIDIILLDITMPAITGYELCRAIKSFEATRHIPVLMLTAAGQSEQVQRGYDAGAAGYLVKPFEIGVFRRTLKKLLEEDSK